jgi:hypothetical protein
MLNVSSYTLYFNFTQLIPLDGDASVIRALDTKTSWEQEPKVPIGGFIMPGSAITGDLVSVGGDVTTTAGFRVLVGVAVGIFVKIGLGV